MKLEGENHSTTICKICKNKIITGKPLTYIRINETTPTEMAGVA